MYKSHKLQRIKYYILEEKFVKKLMQQQDNTKKITSITLQGKYSESLPTGPPYKGMKSLY